MTTFDEAPESPDTCADVMSPDAVAAMERRLLAAFAQHHAPVPVQVSNYQVRWVAAAAVVVLAGGLAAWRGMHGAHIPGAHPASHDVVRSAVDRRLPADAEAAVVSEAAQRAGGSAEAHRRRQGVRRNPRPESPVAFVALPGSSALPRFESGSIVRVDLPLSSLVAYGVDISGAAGQGPVATDVLVGQDGQARAIRLVSTTSTSFSTTRSRQ